MLKPIFDEQDSIQQQQQNMLPSISGSFNVGNSVLILMSPRDINDHHKRPFVYNFNNAIIESVADKIVSSPNMNHSVKNVMNGVPDINHAIVPSSTGFDVATSAYSHCWSFVFIIDDNSTLGRYENNNITNRFIYFGICAQEPISQMGLMSATPERFLNPKCNLVVTKQLMLKKYSTLGANGYRNQIRTSISDNIVQYNGTLWNGSGDSTYYTLDPSSIHNRVMIESDQISTVNDLSSSINFTGSAKISSSLESPRKQMSDILSAIQTGTQNVSYMNTIGSFSDEAVSPICAGLDDTNVSFQAHVHSALTEKGMIDNQIGNAHMLNFNMMTIGTLMSNYNSRVIPITIPQSNKFDIIPQSYRSINNIFSSLVCSVIPSYMSNTNLSEVAFMYNSYHDAIAVKHIASASSVDQEVLKLAWQSFEYILRTDLFPLLKHNGGDFDLQVISSLNTSTDVVLNFLDSELLPIGAVYRENTSLGGITSSMVGNTNHVEANALRLNELIQNVSYYAKTY